MGVESVLLGEIVIGRVTRHCSSAKFGERVDVVPLHIVISDEIEAIPEQICRIVVAGLHVKIEFGTVREFSLDARREVP